ncbi:uncharacterized protein LOC143229872 [Tachypleus tridentatus]|uniref:uncharacterized protein LOC143229872 n=1 Tax=Tachypleus tridentatus TaxID=6853 RepID=UPI003FD2C908
MMIPARVILTLLLLQAPLWTYATQPEEDEPSVKLPDYEKNQQSSGDDLTKYVVMYEKRAQFDSPESYGKGPWELFTYGFGVKYGHNPTKRIEKGYGYVKALGRDFCKENPEHCASFFDPNAFLYRGIKEPYWGYQARGSSLHALTHGLHLKQATPIDSIGRHHKRF